MNLAKLFFYLGLVTIGQLTFRILPTVTISDLFFIIALCIMAFINIKSQRLSLAFIKTGGFLYLGIFLYSLSALLTAFFSENELDNITQIIKLLFSSLGLIYITFNIIKSEKDIIFSILCLGLSGAINGMGALSQAIISPDIIPNTEAYYQRMTGFTQHVNDLNSMESVLIYILLSLVILKKKIDKLLPLILLAFSFLGIVLSGSTSGLLGLAVAMLLWLLTQKASLSKILGITTILLSSFLLISLQSLLTDSSFQDQIDRVFAGGDSYESTSASRFDTYKYASKSILTNIFIGKGISSGGSKTEDGLAVHNILINAWYETGILGFLGMGLIITSIYIISYKALKKASYKKIKILLLGIHGSIIVFIVYSMTAPVLVQRHLWIIVAIALSASAISHRHNVKISKYTNLHND